MKPLSPYREEGANHKAYWPDKHPGVDLRVEKTQVNTYHRVSSNGNIKSQKLA